MPFTLAHPAVVLPLNWLPKKWFSLTGLVIGSMIPDFESFLRLKAFKAYSHSFLGSVWLGLPTAIVLAFVFHNIVKWPLISHLPKGLQRRFAPYIRFDWNRYFNSKWPTILLSLFIGIASHFFWDGFSHYNGFMVKLIPALQGDLVVFGYSKEIPFLIQYINSILGAIVIAMAIYQLPEEKSVVLEETGTYFWMITILGASLIGFWRVMINPVLRIDDGAVIVTAALVYSIIAAAGWAQLQRLLARRKQAGR